MKGIYRLVRSGTEWLSAELNRIEGELTASRHHGNGVQAATNYANKLRKALRIRDHNRRNGAHPVQKRERK